MVKLKQISLVLIVLILIISSLDYNRQFYSDKNSGKSITVWQRLNGNAYIIKGKYFFPFLVPKKHFKSKSRYTKLVIFNKANCELAILNLHPNEYMVNNLDACYYTYSEKNEILNNSKFQTYPYLVGEYNGIAVLYKKFDN